jgi:hypothetical protein
VTGTIATQDSFYESRMWKVIAPASGSQTATMAWTQTVNGVLGVVTAQGVDQTAPVNNGTSVAGNSANPSFSITSTSGDLAMDVIYGEGALTAPAQTSRWNVTLSASNHGAASTGDGTGTATFSWTMSSSRWAHSGANFKAAPPPGGAFSEVTYVSKMRTW